MKNNGSDIFSYLITHKKFRDWVVSPNDESNFFWKKWMNEHPEAINEVKKAREFIERMTFRKEQLSHDEMDALLEKIIAGEKSAFQPIPDPASRQAPFIYHINQWVKVAAILVICFMVPLLIDSN